jgi:hypothetical protein
MSFGNSASVIFGYITGSGINEILKKVFNQ